MIGSEWIAQTHLRLLSTKNLITWLLHSKPMHHTPTKTRSFLLAVTALDTKLASRY